MKLVHLIVALAAVLLAGCYASGNLLLDADAPAHPLEDGTYSRDGDPADALRVTLTPDGWYSVERFNANGTIGQTERALFNPMGSIAGHPAYAVAIETDDGFAYAMVVADGRRVFMATPDCRDPLDRNLAVDQGAASGDDDLMTPTCKFHNRVALLAALAAFAGQADFGRPYQRH